MGEPFILNSPPVGPELAQMAMRRRCNAPPLVACAVRSHRVSLRAPGRLLPQNTRADIAVLFPRYTRKGTDPLNICGNPEVKASMTLRTPICGISRAAMTR
jgi:hypothetical protein